MSIDCTQKKSEPLELFLRQKSKEFQRPPTAWEVTEKTKKLKSGELVNDKSHEFAGNMYGQGTLSKMFSCSKSATSTSIAPVEDQIEEMRETINKLNVELLAKENKEKTLEEKMLQLMETHDHQSQEMRQQMLK
ncbi:hypothetical protein JHK85_000926 [Glycine max]|nr:hypothetical protein JHK85_000926 [Glycine max]